MKLSGFLVGGLLGAAATVYVSRKRPDTIVWASSALSDLGSFMVGRSMSMITNNNMQRRQASGSAPKHTEKSSEKSADAWDHIEMMVNSDPSVKREVDQIKAESTTQTH